MNKELDAEESLPGKMILFDVNNHPVSVTTIPIREVEAGKYYRLLWSLSPGIFAVCQNFIVLVLVIKHRSFDGFSISSDLLYNNGGIKKNNVMDSIAHFGHLAILLSDEEVAEFKRQAKIGTCQAIDDF